MDDIEFFDTLYSGWSKTTGAENAYWMPEETEKVFTGEWFNPDEGKPYYAIFAVDQEQNKTLVGLTLSEDDAAWITALHGCFADLVRRLHQAVDEAERFDCEKDNVINEMSQLAMENNDLREALEGYRQRYG